MKIICPLCGKSIDHQDNDCDKKHLWFKDLKGKRLWRVRYIHKYEYQFFTEEEFQLLHTDGAILDESVHWDDFDPTSLSGIDSLGDRSPIFKE